MDENEVEVYETRKKKEAKLYGQSFLTRELRACARASYRYDVGNGIRSLDWSIPVNFF